jgi:hypothetical protein
MKDPVRPRQLGCPSLLGRDSRVRVKKRERADKKTAQLFLSLWLILMNFRPKIEMLFIRRLLKFDLISSKYTNSLVNAIYGTGENPH